MFFFYFFYFPLSQYTLLTDAGGYAFKIQLAIPQDLCCDSLAQLLSSLPNITASSN